MTTELAETDNLMSKETLFYYRLVWFLTVPAILFFGFVYNSLFPDVYDPILFRFYFCCINFVVLAWTYLFTTAARKHFIWISWIYTYFVLAYMQWTVIQSGNHSGWLLGWYLSLIACLTFYDRIWPTVLYALFAIGSTLLMNQSLPEQQQLNQWFVIVLVSSAFGLNTAILGTKQSLIATLKEQKDKILQQSRELDEVRAQQFNSSKLASLGEVASGIAHEINNPLTILQGQIFLLKKQLSHVDDESLQNNVVKIEGHATRIAKIVKGISTFSRDGSKDPTEVSNYNELMNESLDFVSAKAKNNFIDLIIAIDRLACPPLDVRKVEISQVIVNILQNAVDHLKNTPETKEKWIKVYTKVEGDKAYLMIENSGDKIPDELQIKIFEPFFTTKEVGEGTGLGLSICKGIMRSHGGDIQIDNSKPNTCFQIVLPVSKTASAGVSQ